MMDLNELKLIKLFGREPCPEAIRWMIDKADLREMWNTCERGDWMWWALIHTKCPTQKQSISFAKWCLESAEKEVSSFASAHSVEYMRNAYSAVAFCEHSAHPEQWALDASNSATIAVAVDAARDGECDTIYGTLIYGLGYAEERKKQADWIRKHIPFPQKTVAKKLENTMPDPDCERNIE